MRDSLNSRNLGALVLLLALGCRSPSHVISEEEAGLISSHVRRISALRPDFDSREREILEDWMREFLRAQAHWDGKAFLDALGPCTTLGEYFEATERVTGLDWRGAVERAFLTWDVRAPELPDQAANGTTSRFHFLMFEGSRAHKSVDLLAAISDEAWEVAIKFLGVREEDLTIVPRLMWFTEGAWKTSDGRVPMILLPSRKSWIAQAPKGMAEGVTRASCRLREQTPYPRALGEFDPKVECTIIYHNAFSLFTVAHEIIHAVAFLACTEWGRFAPEVELQSKDDLDRTWKEAIPPNLLNPFVIEGIANAVAARVPRLRRSLLLEEWLDMLKAKARKGEAPPIDEFRNDVYSPWNASFFDYLIGRFQGEPLRRLLLSRAPDVETAFREALGEDLPALEAGWRRSLLE